MNLKRKNEVAALHRYFIWANFMRIRFDHLNTQSENIRKAALMEMFLYMSYWYAGLYVVIEGWREVSLHDPEVDELLTSPLVETLRRYRNAVFHFQRVYSDERFLEFLREGEKSITWVRQLNQAFGRSLLQTMDPQNFKP